MSMSSDLGVVLYLANDTTPTYTDRNGQTQNAVAIDTTYKGMDPNVVESAEFHIGRGQACLITAYGVLGGATSFEWALLIKRVDSSGVVWKWAKVQTTRLDGGGTAAVQQIVAADLLEPDGATQADVDYALTGHRMSGTAKLIGKYTGGPVGATTRLVLAVDVQ